MGSACLSPPKRLPIPAAMTTNVGFIKTPCGNGIILPPIFVVVGIIFLKGITGWIFPLLVLIAKNEKYLNLAIRWAYQKKQDLYRLKREHALASYGIAGLRTR